MCMGTTNRRHGHAGQIRFTPMCMGTTLHRYRDRGTLRFTPMCMATTEHYCPIRRLVSVHPHVHGDNDECLPHSAFGLGSPPCAWGQRTTVPMPCRRIRFTPMCMGTTTASVISRSVQCGSPPCAWGQRLDGTNWLDVCGFTPMCMGTTHALQSNNRRANGSPPCAWGQLSAYAFDRLCSCGSPPCAWGQRCGRSRATSRNRFTPMCMGTTVSRATRTGTRRFTPMCMGTTLTGNITANVFAGSPPCAWGQRWERLATSPRCPVHPHVHGDNVGQVGDEIALTGSPPCAWGQRRQRSRSVAA